MAKKWLPPWGDRSSADVQNLAPSQTKLTRSSRIGSAAAWAASSAPRLDVSEDDKAVTITAELPGVKENEIEVSLVGDQLTLKGEKRSEHEGKEEVTRPRCAPHRTFLRCVPGRLTVPYQVEADQVSAQFRDGVLTVTLPKTT